MCPNEVSRFFNIAIMLPFSVRPDGMGITCVAREFFMKASSFYPHSKTSSFKFLDWYTHLLRNSPTGTIHVHVEGNSWRFQHKIASLELFSVCSVFWGNNYCACNGYLSYKQLPRKCGLYS
jgi:hypothetical protein